MTADWTPLDAELARWTRDRLVLPLWWRDDDAVAPTAALDRLAVLAEGLGLPVHLAVIPAPADAALARAVAAHPGLVPVVHGWAHLNHAPAGARKAEFGAHRPAAEMLDEAARGLSRLAGMFGARLVPMFVPPWNRIDPDLVPRLAGAGYGVLSTFTPRAASWAAPGLTRINTHLDPIAWKAGGGLAAPQALIAQLTRQLADRRAGRADNGEPYGILTHHRVHDAEIWAFVEALLARLAAGPARRWRFGAPPTGRN